MRAFRRAALTIALMIIALLPVVAVAAMAADTAPSPVVPMAITQPLGRATANPFGTGNASGPLPESGLIVLVGSGLLGLAAVVRRTTGI